VSYPLVGLATRAARPRSHAIQSGGRPRGPGSVAAIRARSVDILDDRRDQRDRFASGPACHVSGRYVRVQ